MQATKTGQSITTVSPSQVIAGGAAFTLNVLGSNFTPNAVVQWKGSARPTTFVSNSLLQAAISAADIAQPGVVAIAVLSAGNIQPSNSFSLQIQTSGSLQITTTSLPVGQAQNSYTTALAASGGKTAFTWSVAIGSLPAGLGLNSSTGVISGTPTASGLSTFTVKVTDSSAPPQLVSKQLSINVAEAVPPLQIATTSLLDGQVQSAYTNTLAASGGKTAYTWSVTIGSLPAGLNLNSSTGVISGTPTTAGLSTFTVKVTDSSAPPQSVSKQLSINVAAAVPPLQIATASLPDGQVQSAYTSTLAASGGKAAYTWSVTIGSLPAGLNLNSSTGVISGTPTASGLSTFTVKVTDSSAPPQSVSKQFSINIAAVVPPLQITTTSLPDGLAQSAYTSTLAASGGKTAYTWSVTIGSLPAGLSLNGSTGVISGTPSASGTFTFTVQAKDSSPTPQTATKQLSIAISAAPVPLTITTSGLASGTVNTAYNATLAASGGVTPYIWSVKSGVLPTGMSLTASTGAISGTPTAAGNFGFVVQVTDAKNMTASATLNINIQPVTPPPPPSIPKVNHVFIVVEENTNYADVTSFSMPYLVGLAQKYGLATQYYANTHPSIGNYLVMTDGIVETNNDGLSPNTFVISHDNVVRELIAAGKTWKQYAESIPSVGYIGPDSGNFATRHTPLPYYSDAQTAAQKNNIVPFTHFATDLANGTLPNYSFVTPNLCNDAHNCSITTADTWLKTNIDPLIQNLVFQQDGLLVILFDESGSDNTNGGGRVFMTIVCPKASKPGYQSTTVYQHDATLRLMMEALGLTSFPGAAATAPVMTEFFK